MSYGLYIGKNHTADGRAYLAGYGDEPSSHWLEVVPRVRHPENATITVGVTPEADVPGVLSEIPQVRETSRHLRVSYSYYKGTPAPLTNGGLNEYGVAVRDIWSPSRPELIEMTPKHQRGPNYSDLARILLERARSAREGVDLIAQLIVSHGHSTYGGNSHIIADANEAWIIIQYAGGANLWAAERLGPSSIRASRPGYINSFPAHEKHPDFLYSDNFISFAVNQGWFDPAQPLFDAGSIYGDGRHRWPGVQWIEDEMAARAARKTKITLADIMWAVRTPRLTGDTAGYGQIVPLVVPAFSELLYIWHTQTAALAAPFVPVYLGIDTIPEEYRQHRYLTAGESARFLDGRKPNLVSAIPLRIEASRSATRVFKRLLYVTLYRHDAFLDEVLALWEAWEKRLAELNKSTLATAEALLVDGKVKQARTFLTYVSNTELSKALNGAETMAAALELRSRVLDDASRPAPPNYNQIW